MNSFEVYRKYWPKSIINESTNTEGVRRPTYDVGEYLPPIKKFEVEVVRIHLASTTGDVYSIRLKITEDKYYEVNIHDEYESIFSEFKSLYQEIPTQGEMFDLIMDMETGWSTSSYILSLIDYNDLKSIEEVVDFIQFDSNIYPDLNDLFEEFLKRNIFD